MAKIMVLGDTHGDRDATCSAIASAAMHEVKTIIQVGDFGLWDHFADGVWFIDDINEKARSLGVKVYALGGNHENWDHWNWYVQNLPKDAFGFTILRSHIRIAPKTHRWTMFDKGMAIAGGAVSIDKMSRLITEQRTGEKTMYWPNEQLLDADVMSFGECQKVDYLFTHDCSNATPFHGRMKPDFESQLHRQRIDEVLRRLAPDLHFHGHMHTKYDWMNLVNTHVMGPTYIQTYGLEMNGMFYNWGLLDTETDTFEFRPASPSLAVTP